MRMNDLDVQELEALRIRALQGRFHVEHEALLNWGAWSRDRCIGPRLARQHLLDAHDGDIEGYAEEGEAAKASAVEAKAERPQEKYDEKSAAILDERIHSAGGMGTEARKALRTAYVDGGPREGRWYLYANCPTPQAFVERLEAALRFVRRFV